MRSEWPASFIGQMTSAIVSGYDTHLLSLRREEFSCLMIERSQLLIHEHGTSSHLISTLDSRISMIAWMSTHPAPVYPERDCLSDIMLGMQVRQHDIRALAQSTRTVHIVMDLDSCIQLSTGPVTVLQSCDVLMP